MLNRDSRSAHPRRGIKTVLKYLQAYRKQIFVLAILSLLSAMGNAATPYLAGKLLDVMFGQAKSILIFSYPVSMVVLILSLWLLARLIMDFAGRYKTLLQEELGAVIDADYIINGFSKLIFLPISFHKKSKIGEVTARIQRAAGWLEQIINRMIINLAPEFFSIFIALIFTFFIKPELSVLLLGAIGVYVFILLRVAPRLSVISQKMNRAYTRAYGDAYDVVANVQAVKQATAEKYEKRKLFRNFRLRAARLWTDYIRIGGNLSFAQGLLVTFTQFFLFLASIYFIRKGELTVGGLVAFNGYAAMLVGPFVPLGRNWDVLQNGLVAVERAEEILRQPEEIYVPRDAIILRDVKGQVEFRQVGFRYARRQQQVLKDISVKVEAGKTIALVGESGVGKTTFIDLISFYYRPSSGKIFLDGHDTSKIDLTTLRSAIAVVPQEVVLFNDTIKNNIRYGRFSASDEEVLRAAQSAHANEFIQSFPNKYSQVVGERGIKLSTGQKQRIAIARAILRDPKILILDEPTSALDAKSEAFIADSLSKLLTNRTTFIIAHRLSTVRRADLILVFEKGSIVEQGSHEELIHRPQGVYRYLYELQIGLK